MGLHSWTRQETADYYGVDPRTVDRWLARGEIPAKARIRIGGSSRFVASLLVDDIDDRATAAASLCRQA